MSKKMNRNKISCATYRNNDTREKNKAYKLIKHLERNPECKTGKAALESLPEFCVKSARERLKKARKQTEELS